MPDVTVLKHWVELLRTTKCKQTQGRYRKGENEFCATGLLLYDIQPHKWKPSDCDCGNCRNSYLFTGDAEAVKYLVGQKCWGTALGMNDSGKSFAEIADRIEKEFIK